MTRIFRLSRLNDLSLSLKLLIPTIIFTGLVIFIFTSLLIKDQRLQKEALLEQKAEVMTYLLVQSNIDSLWNYRIDQLRDLSEAFFKDQDIIEIQVKDARGNIYVDLKKDISGSKEIRKTSKVAKFNEHIGELETVFTNYYIEQNLMQIKYRLIGLAAVLFCLIAILVVVISGLVLKPMASVLEGMNQVAKGDHEYQIKITSNDEIGQLAGRFNEMAKQIIFFQNAAVEAAGAKKEMEIAKNIQMSLLPSLDHFSSSGFDISANMTPAEDVGGDYYDLIRSCDDKLWFGIGDVTGHGLLSGLVMMMAQVAVNTLIRSVPGLTPENVLIYTNQTIQANIRNGLKKDHHMTITFVKEEAPGLYRYAGAHEIMLIYRAAEHKVEQIQTRGMWLGVIPDISKPTRKFAGEFQLSKDDILFLYTDGVIEIKNKDAEQYDLDRLCQFLIENAAEPAETIKQNLLAALNQFKDKQLDDITFIIMKKE